MRTRLLSSARQASTLVYIDHNGQAVANGVRNTITAASKIGGDVTALVAGGDEAVSACVCRVKMSCVCACM